VAVEPGAVRKAVKALYDRDAAHEWARGDRHRTEFAITRRALRQYLPAAPARILDCGGGPGRYAIELARQGYDVTLFDLSDGNLALAREKAAEAGVELRFERGTALDLSRFDAGVFDAVLLMGPLYHLLTEGERLRALAEARRVLKPGGPLFAAFIGRYAAHRDAAVQYPTEPVEMPGLYEEIEQTGILPPREGVSFVAYFAHPTEVEPLVRKAGLDVVETLGVEGLVSVIEDVAVNELTGAAWDWWLETNWRAAHDPAIFGAVEHLLVIARNPAQAEGR
jgi:ubiquinone/menaquinone biosynthesis C-methylase UbiE